MKRPSDWVICWKAYVENSRNPLQNKVSQNSSLHCEIRLFQFLIKIANLLRLEKLDKIKSDLFCRQIQLLVHRSLNNSLLEVREVWLSPGKYELVISEEKITFPPTSISRISKSFNMRLHFCK